MIELPRSTYYYRSAAMALGLDDDRLVDLIGDIQDEFPGYGYRCVTLELRARGHHINHKRAARIMRERGLGIKPRKRFTPKQKDNAGDTQFFPNLYRNVIPELPDQAWVADITFIRIQAGFVYLAVILDACSRKVVGYAISRQIDTNLTLAALKAAVQTRQPAPNTCIHHTDRGSQYASWRYRQALIEYGLTGSMSAGKPLSQRPGRKLYENPESGGSIFVRLPDICRCHRTSASFYRGGLQYQADALRLGLCIARTV